MDSEFDGLLVMCGHRRSNGPLSLSKFELDEFLCRAQLWTMLGLIPSRDGDAASAAAESGAIDDYGVAYMGSVVQNLFDTFDVLRRHALADVRWMMMMMGDKIVCRNWFSFVDELHLMHELQGLGGIAGRWVCLNASNWSCLQWMVPVLIHSHAADAAKDDDDALSNACIASCQNAFHPQIAFAGTFQR